VFTGNEYGMFSVKTENVPAIWVFPAVFFLFVIMLLCHCFVFHPGDYEVAGIAFVKCMLCCRVLKDFTEHDCFILKFSDNQMLKKHSI